MARGEPCEVRDRVVAREPMVRSGSAYRSKTEFHWETPNYFNVDSRAVALSAFFAPTAKLGSGSFYLGTYHDSSGENLRGENEYRLRVPANVPVREFWALTVYDRETAALFRNCDRPTLGSLDKGLLKNADGSVDLYVGPKAPDGKEANCAACES